MKNLNKIGRYLSLLLRHHPEKEDLEMDTFGYVSVKDLLEKLEITQSNLDWIVKNNDKRRFSYNSDKTKIRANQGHSKELNVHIEMKELSIEECPKFLFHGTVTPVSEKIWSTGLNPMSRKHVHMTDDIESAVKVGNRRSSHDGADTRIIVIEAQKAISNGCKIFISENGIYLSEKIPSYYLLRTRSDFTKFNNQQQKVYLAILELKSISKQELSRFQETIILKSLKNE